jgi:organic hydroperoxide reductase OsmC/OhrA
MAPATVPRDGSGAITPEVIEGAPRVGHRGPQVDDVAIDSKVMLIAVGGGAMKLGAELALELPSIEDPAQAADLVRAAHGICPYSNATRGNIDVAISVNGEALER